VLSKETGGFKVLIATFFTKFTTRKQPILTTPIEKLFIMTGIIMLK